MYMLCVVVGVGGGAHCVYVVCGCRGWWRGALCICCVVVGVGGGGHCVYVVCGCRGWWRGALCICCVWL